MTITQMDLLPHTHETMTENLKKAVMALREGKMILLLDAHERENEGDLIIAAEKITPESMNFFIKHGSGIVCLPLPKHRLLSLGLHPMLPENTNSFQTAFTVSIEARLGVTTGVSAKDRAHTIKTAIADDAKSSDLARPGHVFPLAAVEGGVFARMGHTEGSVDLMNIAGLKPGAVLCELMNEDGSMTIGEDRARFAARFDMPVVSVEEILFHRMNSENIFVKSQKNINTRFGNLSWQKFCFFNTITIDVFLRQNSASSEKAAHVSLVSGDNLSNRYMAQILTQSPDDSLISALSNLENGGTDLVIMMGGEILATKSHDVKSKMHGAICRTLRELMVTKISAKSIGEELGSIAHQYFSITVC
jgi:3,4-dihydroxy-2-butanone 4-phosphate synthase